MKKIIQIAPVLVVVAFAIASGLSMAFAISPLIGLAIAAPIVVVASLVGTGSEYSTNAGLNKEVWLEEILEGFYADDMFISECRDLSPFVDNDVINLAEAGVDPTVLINNTTYPISVNDRADTALTITIDQFDTENTKVVKAEAIELAYDKLASVVLGHKNALRMKIMEKAAHAIAPASNATYTPVIQTTGADNGSGLKRLKWSDVRKLQKAFNNAEIPSEGRIIILSQQHLEDLEIEDLDRFNRVMDKGIICGFKMYALADKRLPRYNKTTGAKVAFGAAAAPSTDSTATIAFQKDEVARAMGTSSMFHSKAEDDPIYRRDVVGFQQRAIVIPIRNKGIAAIYSPAA